MIERVRILLIDDDEDEYFLLKEMAYRSTRGRSKVDYDLEWISTYEEAVTAFLDCQYDLYLVDYRLGIRSGLELLQEAAARECSSPVIMLTGQGTYETDLSAMQLGVADYLEKSQLTWPLLERSIRYALERKQAEKHLETLVQELAALQKATSSLLNTLDLSLLMGQILDAVQQAIPSAERGALHLFEKQHGLSRRLMEISVNDPRIYRIKLPEPLPDILKDVVKGRSLSVADIQAEPVLRSLAENQQEWRDIRSGIIAPLVLSGEVLGALSLSASISAAFSNADLDLLTSFATTATAAIHNAILYSEIQNLATIDPLTGQLNRRTFFELSQREIDRFQRFGHPLSWIMFDVDWFKQINDKYGHSAGDQVLIELVDRCCHVIRHVDIFGRFGGDEFVVLLPETDSQMAIEIADRVRTTVSASPIETDAGPILVTISMGITQATPETADLGLLLNKADQALYKSKRSGRNKITVLL